MHTQVVSDKQFIIEADEGIVIMLKGNILILLKVQNHGIQLDLSVFMHQAATKT